RGDDPAGALRRPGDRCGTSRRLPPVLGCEIYDRPDAHGRRRNPQAVLSRTCRCSVIRPQLARTHSGPEAIRFGPTMRLAHSAVEALPLLRILLEHWTWVAATAHRQRQHC